MLQVIKRLGYEEPFSSEKIKNSLAAASDELGLPLNHADLNNICDQLVDQLEGRERVTSREIYDLLLHILQEEGFTTLAISYEKDSKNTWSS